MTETTTSARDNDLRRSLRHRAARAGLALLGAAALAACGGGGGGGDGGGGGGATHAIAGRVEGLTASGLVLQNNGADNLPIGAAGAFRFTQTVAHGGAYAVTVFTQPAGQACIVAHGSGTANDDVSNIVVTCANNPPPPPPQTQTVGGSVSGLTSAGLVLRNNGGDGITIAADATSFTFPTAVARGAAYAVSIGTQPQGNDCTVANASGTIAEANVTNVQVSCGPVGPLTLVSSNPASNATNVPRNAVPTLTFSAPLDAATVGGPGGPGSAAVFDVYGPGGRVAAAGHTAALHGAELSLVPAHKLLPGVDYLAGVSAAVRGTRGERLPDGSALAAVQFTTADAAWGEPQAFGPALPALRPDVAASVNRFGDAAVAWVLRTPSQPDRLMVRTRAAAATQWSDASELLSTEAFVGNVSTAVSDAGDIVVVWKDGGLWFARHRLASTGAWSASVRLTNPAVPEEGFNNIRLSAHPSGTVHVVGKNLDSSQIVVISGRIGDASAWQPRQVAATLDTGFRAGLTPHATPLPDGGTMVAWDETGPGGTLGVVRARRLDAAGRPLGSGPVAVTTLPSQAIVPLALAVQPDPAGAADRYTVLVTWRWAGTTEDRIKLRRWYSNVDAWDEERSLAAVRHADGRMGEPAMAAPPGAWAGTRSAQIVWHETRADNGVFRLRGVALPDSGDFVPAEVLVADTAATTPASGAALRPPQVRADRAGNLLVVYEHSVRVVNSRHETEVRSLRRLARSGGWAAATPAGPALSTSREPFLAGASETGSAWLAWWEPDASGSNHALQMKPFD